MTEPPLSRMAWAILLVTATAVWLFVALIRDIVHG